MSTASLSHARARRLAADLHVRQARVARSTGTVVVVYEDTDEECGDGLRWVTLCDDHGRLVGHEDLATARSWASMPEGWCGVCRGDEPLDTGDER